MPLGIHHQGLSQSGFAPQQIREVGGIVLLIAQELVQRGLFQIAVHQKHIFILPAHGQGQVGGNGALAFVLGDRGDHDDLCAGALHLVLHSGTELFHGLHIQKSRGGIRDQKTALFPLEDLFVGLDLVLMVDHRQQTGVQLLLHLALGFDRVAQIGKHRDGNGHQRRACDAGLFGEAAAAGGVARIVRHRGRAQYADGDVAQRAVAQIVIVVHSRLQDAEGHARTAGLGGDHHQVGLADGLGLERPVHGRRPQILGHSPADHIAAQELGEVAGQGIGGIPVGKDRAVAALHDHQGHVGLVDRPIGHLLEQISAGAENDRRQHHCPEIPDHVPDQQDRMGVMSLFLSDGNRLFFIHLVPPPYSTTTISRVVATVCSLRTDV